jgi:tetratricopeptide (TPR) repeat protein
MHRTLSYSQVWKSEENLFLESLSVCPNSAKLNLQVARIHLRHQQYQKAKQHLNKAKLIDPDFCDLHYFEAVVMISMNEDVDTAIDLLVRSLHCIYTSQSAIMLLYQIWDNQLQQAVSISKHRYYKLLEQQGLAAQKHAINFIAVKKLIDASSIAFEERQYKDAINLSTKAEKMVLRSEAAQRNLSTNGSSSGDNSIEGQMVTAEMRCRIFTLIGCYRYFLVSNNMHEGGQGQRQGQGGSSKKTLPLTSKSPQYQATVAKKHLTRAIEQDCFEAILKTGDDQIPSIVIEHIPIAIQHIVTMYSIGFKTTGDKTNNLNTSEVIERSIRLTNAFIVLNVMLHKVIAKMDGTIPTTQNQVAMMTTNNGIMHNEHLVYSSIHERLTQSLKTIEMVASSEWTNCGLLFYRQNNYPKALKCFTEKLKLLCNHSNNQRVSTVLSEFVHDRGAGNYSGILITARTKTIVPHFHDLQLTTDICSTLHW